LRPRHLNYVPGDQVEMPTMVLNEAAGPARKGLRLAARLLGPDLKPRKAWRDLAAIDASEGAESVEGPVLNFTVPADFARSFFFVILDLSDAADKRLARNVYTFRCPPQLEDKAFCDAYRKAPPPLGLRLSEGPWLRPQLEKLPTRLSSRVTSVVKESDRRWRLAVEVKNAGQRPAVMVEVGAAGSVRYVADDAYFWLDPGETRLVNLRLRTPTGTKQSDLVVTAKAWNTPSRTE